MTDNRHKVCGNRKIANFFSIRTQIKFIKPSCNNLINGERAVFLNGSIDYLYGQKFLPVIGDRNSGESTASLGFLNDMFTSIGS